MTTLNRAQSAVTQKLASYFKIPRAKLVGTLSDTQLWNGGLEFNLSDLYEIRLNEVFSCMEGKFHLGNVLDERKFENTPIYQAYLAKDPGHILAFYSGGGSVWILTEYQVPGNTSGILLCYPSIEGSALWLTPMGNFLKDNYPLPS